MTHDTVLMRKRLRAETAKLLKLDVNNLSPAQSVRLDRAATLRLELNDIEECKLNGAPFDTVKYIAASEALERMLGGDPERSQQVDFTGAREELLHFLENRAEALARRDERRSREQANRQLPPVEPPVEPAPPPVAVELLPEGTEPPKQPHVSYVDAAVLEQPHERYQRINGGHATPATQRPVSPLTNSYLGPGHWSDLGGNPWATKNWNPPRGF